MFMQVLWQRPLRSPNDTVTIEVFIDRVFGIKKAFNFADRQRNLDKIFRAVVTELSSIDATVKQPIVNKA